MSQLRPQVGDGTIPGSLSEGAAPIASVPSHIGGETLDVSLFPKGTGHDRRKVKDAVVLLLAKPRKALTAAGCPCCNQGSNEH